MTSLDDDNYADDDYYYDDETFDIEGDDGGGDNGDAKEIEEETIPRPYRLSDDANAASVDENLQKLANQGLPSSTFDKNSQLTSSVSKSKVKIADEEYDDGLDLVDEGDIIHITEKQHINEEDVYTSEQFFENNDAFTNIWNESEGLNDGKNDENVPLSGDQNKMPPSTNLFPSPLVNERGQDSPPLTPTYISPDSIGVPYQKPNLNSVKKKAQEIRHQRTQAPSSTQNTTTQHVLVGSQPPTKKHSHAHHAHSNSTGTSNNNSIHKTDYEKMEEHVESRKHYVVKGDFQKKRIHKSKEDRRVDDHEYAKKRYNQISNNSMLTEMEHLTSPVNKQEIDENLRSPPTKPPLPTFKLKPPEKKDSFGRRKKKKKHIKGSYDEKTGLFGIDVESERYSKLEFYRILREQRRQEEIERVIAARRNLQIGNGHIGLPSLDQQPSSSAYQHNKGDISHRSNHSNHHQQQQNHRLPHIYAHRHAHNYDGDEVEVAAHQQGILVVKSEGRQRSSIKFHEEFNDHDDNKVSRKHKSASEVVTLKAHHHDQKEKPSVPPIDLNVDNENNDEEFVDDKLEYEYKSPRERENNVKKSSANKLKNKDHHVESSDSPSTKPGNGKKPPIPSFTKPKRVSKHDVADSSNSLETDSNHVNFSSKLGDVKEIENGFESRNDMKVRSDGKMKKGVNFNHDNETDDVIETVVDTQDGEIDDEREYKSVAMRKATPPPRKEEISSKKKVMKEMKAIVNPSYLKPKQSDHHDENSDEKTSQHGNKKVIHAAASDEVPHYMKLKEVQDTSPPPEVETSKSKPKIAHKIKTNSTQSHDSDGISQGDGNENVVVSKVEKAQSELPSYMKPKQSDHHDEHSDDKISQHGNKKVIITSDEVPHYMKPREVKDTTPPPEEETSKSKSKIAHKVKTKSTHSSHSHDDNESTSQDEGNEIVVSSKVEKAKSELPSYMKPKVSPTTKQDDASVSGNKEKISSKPKPKPPSTIKDASSESIKSKHAKKNTSTSPQDSPPRQEETSVMSELGKFDETPQIVEVENSSIVKEEDVEEQEYADEFEDDGSIHEDVHSHDHQENLVTNPSPRIVIDASNEMNEVHDNVNSNIVGVKEEVIQPEEEYYHKEIVDEELDNTTSKANPSGNLEVTNDVTESHIESKGLREDDWGVEDEYMSEYKLPDNHPEDPQPTDVIEDSHVNELDDLKPSHDEVVNDDTTTNYHEKVVNDPVDEVDDHLAISEQLPPDAETPEVKKDDEDEQVENYEDDYHDDDFEHEEHVDDEEAHILEPKVDVQKAEISSRRSVPESQIFVGTPEKVEENKVEDAVEDDYMSEYKPHEDTYNHIHSQNDHPSHHQSPREVHPHLLGNQNQEEDDYFMSQVNVNNVHSSYQTQRHYQEEEEYLSSNQMIDNVETMLQKSTIPQHQRLHEAPVTTEIEQMSPRDDDEVELNKYDSFGYIDAPNDDDVNNDVGNVHDDDDHFDAHAYHHDAFSDLGDDDPPASLEQGSIYASQGQGYGGMGMAEKMTMGVSNSEASLSVGGYEDDFEF